MQLVDTVFPQMKQDGHPTASRGATSRSAATIPLRYSARRPLADTFECLPNDRTETYGSLPRETAKSPEEPGQKC